MTARAIAFPVGARDGGHRRPSAVADLIVAAARSLLKTGSYRTLSLDAIVAEAGIARQTAHRYFATFDEIYFAARRELVTEVADLVRFLEPGTGEAVDEVATLLEYLVGACGSEPYLELMRATVVDAGDVPRLPRQFDERVFQPLKAGVETYVARLMLSARLRQRDPKIWSERTLAVVTAAVVLPGLLGERSASERALPVDAAELARLLCGIDAQTTGA